VQKCCTGLFVLSIRLDNIECYKQKTKNGYEESVKYYLW
jgi:hypothetical protein